MSEAFYEGRIFRPPSEANSLIVQITVGCSHNSCRFCSMYLEKRFHLVPMEIIRRRFEEARRYYPYVRRIFLADGDAFVRPQQDLVTILVWIRELFPECERIATYAAPQTIALKTEQERRALQQLGLKLLYMGLESGDEDTLKRMGKANSVQTFLEASRQLQREGFDLSITAIVGLAGNEDQKWRAHALKTAEAFSLIKPKYIGLLTLMLEEGTALTNDYKAGRFQPQTPRGILEELLLLLQNIDAEGSLFRANHASNYLDLRGTLNRDQERLCASIQAVLNPRQY